MASSKKPLVTASEAPATSPKAVAKASTPKTSTPKTSTPKAPAAKKLSVKAAEAKVPASAKPAAKKVAPVVKAAAKPVTKAAAKKVPKSVPVVEGPSVDAAQRANYIEVAAYYIAQRRGFTPGDAQQDYLDAAAEIDQLIGAGHFSK